MGPVAPPAGIKGAAAERTTETKQPIRVEDVVDRHPCLGVVEREAPVATPGAPEPGLLRPAQRGKTHRGGKSGAAVGSRTPNLLIRSQMLYPIELRLRNGR